MDQKCFLGPQIQRDQRRGEEEPAQVHHRSQGEFHQRDPRGDWRVCGDAADGQHERDHNTQGTSREARIG